MLISMVMMMLMMMSNTTAFHIRSESQRRCCVHDLFRCVCSLCATENKLDQTSHLFFEVTLELVRLVSHTGCSIVDGARFFRDCGIISERKYVSNFRYSCLHACRIGIRPIVCVDGGRAVVEDVVS